MKEWQTQLNEWWRHLSLREQRVVATGGIIGGLLLFYLLIWGPYLERLQMMRQQIQTDYKTLVWMQAADKELNKLTKQSNKPSLTPIALLSVLQKQVEEAGFANQMLQLKQASANTIEMQFQQVEFDALMKLLIHAAKEQQVVIARLSVVADKAPGVVNASVVLSVRG